MIEVPFVLFAVFLPLVGQGERIDVLGLSLSVEGLWAMWNILIKGTIGVAASVILASTTSVAGFLQGLDRLHLPSGVHVDHRLHGALLRGDHLRGPSHEGRTRIPWLRRSLAVAGERVRGVRGRAVHPVVRTR